MMRESFELGHSQSQSSLRPGLHLAFAHRRKVE